MSKQAFFSVRSSLMNPQRIVCLVLSVLLVLTIGPPVCAQEPPEPLQGLDAYIGQAVADWNVPGLAIAVVKDDEIVLAKGYGVREVGKEEPVDEHTIFAIGSSTKAFAAATVALLVDEGKLSWDDPVTKHLPRFQMYDPWVTRELTVRDTLCHRSGLPEHGGDALYYFFDYDQDEILRRVRYIKPESSFRSEFAYQNLMYIAAGAVVAAISGQNWQDFVTERILDPLGMTESSASITGLAGAVNVATPHMEFGGGSFAIPWRNIDNEAPAGSINSTALDMAQWLRLQLGEGLYEEQQLLSPASVREMHHSQTVVRNAPPSDVLYPDISFLSYGMGWYLFDYAGHKVVRHSGMIDGMTAMVAMMPQENLGVVILTNTSWSILPFALTLTVFDAFLDIPEQDWSSQFLERQKVIQAFLQQSVAAPERMEGTTPSLPLSDYAGTYVNEADGEMKITMEDGKLVVEVEPAGIKADLEYWQYDTFRMAWLNPIYPGFATFTLDATGKVDEMKVGGGNILNASFERVPETPDPPGESP